MQDPNNAGSGLSGSVGRTSDRGDDSSCSTGKGLGDGLQIGSARFALVARSVDGEEREFELGRAKTIIGRMSRCHLMVALPLVADQHCEVELDDDGLTVTDLDTEHGTLINGERTTTARLRNGDVIGIGPMQFHVRDRHHGHKSLGDTLAGAVEGADAVSRSPEIETLPTGVKSSRG